MKRYVYVAVFGVALLASPAFAHHSFAMFDTSKLITLTGTITEFQWSNPHSWIEINVPGPDGNVDHYSLEGGSTHVLARMGWKSKMLKPGDKVTVTMQPLRSGMKGGAVQTVTFADGRKIDGGGR